MSARVALALAAFCALLAGCGIPPDPRTVEQAVQDAVEAEPPPPGR